MKRAIFAKEHLRIRRAMSLRLSSERVKCLTDELGTEKNVSPNMIYHLFVCLFKVRLYVPVNSHVMSGHCLYFKGLFSSPEPKAHR